MMRARALAAASCLALFACHGPKGCEPAAPEDGSLGGAASTSTMPKGPTARPAIHLVARILARHPRLVLLDDGAVVLDTNVFLWALDTARPPHRIGDVAAYAPLVPPDDAPRTAPELVERHVHGKRAKLEIVTALPSGAFEWRAGTWTFMPLDDVERSRRTPSDAAPRPDGVSVDRHCERVRTVDGNDWVSCSASAPFARDVLLRRRLEWINVALGGEAEAPGPLAVAKDGALWIGAPDKERETDITRVFEKGVDRLPLPDAVGPKRASYTGSYGAPTEVVQSAPEVARAVTDLAPARDGTMWILASGPTGHALYRAGGERPEAVALMGSVYDQHAEIANTQPRRRWIGHCEAVFVPLVRATRSAFPIEKIRTYVHGGYPRVVIGWLGEERVAGAFFPRVVDDTTERGIESFIANATENPLAPPEATCTLPVLERTMDL